MRPTPLLLTLALLIPGLALAVQSAAQPLAEATSAQTHADQLEQRLAESVALVEELQNAENAQLQRLRQDNQRLKLELKQAQANSPAPLISEQQMWFAIGAGAGLLGVIVGAMLRRGRRKSSEWLN
jgi:SH3 domain protein